ncbi:uncharacterized protein N7459_006562 [Penicillium hispanicum]|uniref:uncharacterized protein n=1 Tax=Penicillium hispanicum TaxID=1080232 RepID=UPI002540B8C0|nr:uncharacterized protein N7459_006562 [Penicillium hispanicum]KAJ5577598.1 hypothetical protein N7459_006562 [Penicillium hispanicum]
MKAKRRLETSEADMVDDDDANSDLFGSADAVQEPILAPSDVNSSETCDPLQNITCLDDVPVMSEAVLSRRQEAEPTHGVQVETVLQVVDANSQTLWQSAGVDFPMTISGSAFGALTLSDISASPTESISSTPSTDLPVTQSRTSSMTDNTAPMSKSVIPISSPRVTTGISSIPHLSTPLVSISSFPSLTPSSFLMTSVPTSSPSYSTSSPSVTSSIPESSSSSSSSTSTTSMFGGSGETGTGTGTGTGAGSSATTSDAQSSGSGSSGSTNTPQIVGGVVGSVAGLAVLVLLLFYLLRRRKLLQGKGTDTLPSSDAGAREVAERGASNDPFFTASYLAPAFMKRWRQSTMTTRTESSVDSYSSERGFQKISGRKIPPVLTHGGDGYGGGLGGDSPTIPDFMTGLPPTAPAGGPLSSSSQGPPTTSPYGVPLDTSFTREAEETSSPARPPPVRLPVSSSVNFGTPTTVNPSHPVPQPQSALTVAPSRPDGLGRSLPSHDGSRGSRFTESLEM